ncbi:uncharacterized protein LOC124439942 [Xenia sp. Carnegie-2017]|uniref:uncharacterized protein LOC124439942 n=1 Tax=Xenia sp. Carnegie-2017 TaxID=2897299 RepID=UPI001F04D140|nr:uncharacterized protein LOC124439942 [Xenia sp. Carnegie-2017]
MKDIDVISASDISLQGEQHGVESGSLQEKCPAFKDGCPFTTLEEQALKDVLEKCPEFTNGCPFKEAKTLSDVYNKLSQVPHSAGDEDKVSDQKLVKMFKSMHGISENLEEKMGNCPVFHKDQGCPFKSVLTQDGKHLVEPAESVISSESITPSECVTFSKSVTPSDSVTTSDSGIPSESIVPSGLVTTPEAVISLKFSERSSSDDLIPLQSSEANIMITEVNNVQETCPAFKHSCPFSTATTRTLRSFQSASKCPEFKEACPFKDCKIVNDIYGKLEEIPDLETENGSHSELIKSLKLLHNMCVELEKQIGECPVFNTQTGCPFKTICGDGKLMITHIEENTTTSVIKEVSLEVRQELEDELVSSMGIVLHHELEVKTMRKHRQTTKAPFIKAIMKGKLDVDSYKLFMYNMYFLYKVMEEEGDRHREDPKVKHVYFPKELRRTPEIIKDLEYYYGSDWKGKMKPMTTIRKYIARLRQLGDEEPMLLLAHQFTRYLGDMEGGQIMKKIVRKTFQLTGSNGVCFYEFANIPNLSDFKKVYRTHFDSLNLGKKDADRMVEESLKSFDFHIEFFAELACVCNMDSDQESKVKSAPLPEQRSLVKKKEATNVLFVMSLGLTVAFFAVFYSFLLG